jgi:hypothetical protein
MHTLSTHCEPAKSASWAYEVFSGKGPEQSDRISILIATKRDERRVEVRLCCLAREITQLGHSVELLTAGFHTHKRQWRCKSH